MTQYDTRFPYVFLLSTPLSILNGSDSLPLVCCGFQPASRLPGMSRLLGQSQHSAPAAMTAIPGTAITLW